MPDVYSGGSYSAPDPFSMIGNIGGSTGGGRGGGGGSTAYGDTSLGFQKTQDEKSREFNAQNALAQQDLAFRQGKFNSVFGLLNGQLGNNNPSALLKAFYPGGGPVGQAPRIDAGPIWNQQQVQQQVNSAHATNDQTTAGNIRDQQASAVGRGFGMGSPLLQELGAQQQAANLAANSDAERNIRWNAAQGNAAQTLKGQTAKEGQYASRQSEDIQRKTPIIGGYFGSRNALIGALAGIA